MLHWIATAINTYLVHPEHGNGYQWWSGPGSDLGEASVVGMAAAWFKHRTCHEHGCWRLGHAHPKHGFPVCRRHYHRFLDA
jgi:hypothetical protein